MVRRPARTISERFGVSVRLLVSANRRLHAAGAARPGAYGVSRKAGRISTSGTARRGFATTGLRRRRRPGGVARTATARLTSSADIAYHLDKARARLRARRSTSGARIITGTSPRMKAAARAGLRRRVWLEVADRPAGESPARRQPVKMSKREGEFVTLDELVEDVGKDRRASSSSCGAPSPPGFRSRAGQAAERGEPVLLRAVRPRAGRPDPGQRSSPGGGAGRCGASYRSSD